MKNKNCKKDSHLGKWILGIVFGNFLAYVGERSISVFGIIGYEFNQLGEKILEFNLIFYDLAFSNSFVWQRMKDVVT
jgi:hypothetical protein